MVHQQLRRIHRRLLRLYDYSVLYLGLLLLGLMSLAWTLIAGVLYLLLPSRLATRLGRRVISIAFRVYLFSLTLSRRCSFDLRELDSLRAETPLIIAPNHPSLLDAVMILSRLPNVACVMKSGLMNNVFLGAGARLARYIRNEPIRRMVQQASHDFRHGSHVLLFPEGTRTTSAPVNTLKGSIALIARQARVPVQTVLIETNSPYLSKGWGLFRKPRMPIHYKIRLGRRFDPPVSSQALMTELQAYYAQALSHSYAQSVPAPAQDSTLPPALLQNTSELTL